MNILLGFIFYSKFKWKKKSVLKKNIVKRMQISFRVVRTMEVLRFKRIEISLNKWVNYFSVNKVWFTATLTNMIAILLIDIIDVIAILIYNNKHEILDPSK